MLVSDCVFCEFCPQQKLLKMFSIFHESLQESTFCLNAEIFLTKFGWYHNSLLFLTSIEIIFPLYLLWANFITALSVFLQIEWRAADSCHLSDVCLAFFPFQFSKYSLPSIRHLARFLSRFHWLLLFILFFVGVWEESGFSRLWNCSVGLPQLSLTVRIERCRVVYTTVTDFLRLFPTVADYSRW